LFTVNASSSLIYKTLDDAEKLKIQLVRGVKFHGFFAVIPSYSYEIDRDRSSERVSKTHSYAGFFLPFFSTFFFLPFFTFFLTFFLYFI